MLSHLRHIHRWLVLPLVALLLVATATADDLKLAPAITKGQHVFTCGHSFHVWVPGIIADLAKKAEIKDHVQVGLSSIGGSRVIQHWAPAETTTAKDAKDLVLPAETLTVVSTARFPDSGELTVESSEGGVGLTYTGKTGTTFTGCKGGKGTLGASKKVTSPTNIAREALKTGKVDVLTLSPIFLPDPGIENFTKLAVEHNKDIRILVQPIWLRWDIYEPTTKKPAKVDHNAITGEELRKRHAEYYKVMNEHIEELNKKQGKTVLYVVPAAQAVLALREKIIAGQAPGLKEQEDLFTDELGHGKPPLQAIVAYCNYGVMYRRSPVGLPVPAVLKGAKLGDQEEKLNRLLQELAWQAVLEHPLSGVRAEARP